MSPGENRGIMEQIIDRIHAKCFSGAPPENICNRQMTESLYLIFTSSKTCLREARLYFKGFLTSILARAGECTVPIDIQMANRTQVPLSSCIIRYTLTNMLTTGRNGSKGTCWKMTIIQNEWNV